jgi:hypothetical protein
MKHVKAFNIFEATKSKILGKTLRNVTSSARRDILSMIKSICVEATNTSATVMGKMPLSEVSDKYFKYERKSQRTIGLGGNEHTLCPTCNGDGYIQTASTTKKAVSFSSKICTDCSGVGVEYTRDKNLYKFWLSEDGELNKITFTDGEYYGGKSSPSFWKTDRISLPANGDAFDFTPGQEKFIDENEIVPGKTRIILKYGRTWNPDVEIGVFWKDNNGEYHFVNNGIGSTKTRGQGVSIAGTKWKDLGTHHISLTKINNDESSYKIELYKIVSNEPIDEPFGYNQRVSVGYRGVSKSSTGLEDNELNGSDYVILFDADKYFADVEAGEFKSTDDTKKEREEARTGAAALKNNDSVRKANLERYRQKIADLNLREGLGKLINKTPHLIGGTNFLLFSLKDTFRWDFERLINEVYDYLDSVESGKDVDYHERQVVDKVKSMISNNQRKNAEYIEYITEIKKQMENSDPRMAAEFMKLHKEFERISRDYKNSYFSKKFETIEQLSTISATIKMLDHLEDNRRIVPTYIWKISDYFNLSRSSSYNNVTVAIMEEWEKNGDLSESMEKMKRLESSLKFM